MKKVIVSFLFLFFISSSSAYAKKPGGSGWQSGNAGHQLGCLIISIFGLSGCEKPKAIVSDSRID